MTFEWPWMLLSLGAIPLLVLGYRRVLRRRAARRGALAALGLVTLVPRGEASTGRRLWHPVVPEK